MIGIKEIIYNRKLETILEKNKRAESGPIRMEDH